jgi:bacterial/archaeal transporter family-2 protein
MQLAVNANLRTSVGSAAWAGLVSYVGGIDRMLMVVLFLREAVPSTGVLAQSNWWAWTGDFFGAIYIAISIVWVPGLGAAFFIALLVAGQMLGSIAFDHFGLLHLSGAPNRPSSAISARRA